MKSNSSKPKDGYVDPESNTFMKCLLCKLFYQFSQMFLPGLKKKKTLENIEISDKLL